MTTDEKLQEAFQRALGISPGTDCSKAMYGDVEGWDSVAHMALIAEIESTFDIMLDTNQVIGLNSFVKAREIIQSHGVALQS
jgi:acyl carrier protein